MSRHPNKLTAELIRSKTAIDPKTSCWNWISSVQTSGYGQIKLAGKNWTAHRASWVAHNGDIPEGKQVLHRCDNPGCCNPEHMYLGSHYDNMQDMFSRGRRKRHGRAPKSATS